jgi:hypothetical protein
LSSRPERTRKAAHAILSSAAWQESGVLCALGKGWDTGPSVSRFVVSHPSQKTRRMGHPGICCTFGRGQELPRFMPPKNRVSPQRCGRTYMSGVAIGSGPTTIRFHLTGIRRDRQRAPEKHRAEVPGGTTSRSHDVQHVPASRRNSNTLTMAFGSFATGFAKHCAPRRSGAERIRA